MAPVARTHQSEPWRFIGEDLTFHHGDTRGASGWIHLEHYATQMRSSVKFDLGRVIGFSVEVPDGSTLTARNLRSLPLGEVERIARRYLSAIARDVAQKYYAGNGTLRTIAAAELQNTRMTHQGMVAIVAIYCDLCETSPHAASQLAEDLNTTKERIHAVMRQAERNGLFDRSHLPKRGIQGGRLTAKAEQLIAQLLQENS